MIKIIIIMLIYTLGVLLGVVINIRNLHKPKCDGEKVKTIGLKPCPKCKHTTVDIWKNLGSRTFACECRRCHYAGRKSKFVFLAKRRWNYEEIFNDDTENTIKKR